MSQKPKCEKHKINEKKEGKIKINFFGADSLLCEIKNTKAIYGNESRLWLRNWWVWKLVLLASPSRNLDRISFFKRLEIIKKDRPTNGLLSVAFSSPLRADNDGKVSNNTRSADGFESGVVRRGRRAQQAHKSIDTRDMHSRHEMLTCHFSHDELIIILVIDIRECRRDEEQKKASNRKTHSHSSIINLFLLPFVSHQKMSHLIIHFTVHNDKWRLLYKPERKIVHMGLPEKEKAEKKQKKASSVFSSLSPPILLLLQIRAGYFSSSLREALQVEGD